MSNEHPITPSPELVRQWLDEWIDSDESGVFMEKLATQAARWGADQELEACCIWLSGFVGVASADILQETRRRPKPSSLAEEALDSWDRLRNETWCEEIDFDLNAVRAALERLEELEKGNE